MAIRFIDLEKAYATISREMTMGTLMWLYVPGGQGFMQDQIFARHNFGSSVQLFWKTFFFFFTILYPINHTTFFVTIQPKT